MKAVVDHLIGHAAGTGLLDFQRRGVIFLTGAMRLPDIAMGR